MSMRLTLLDLSAISAAVEDLDKIKQVTVHQIAVGRHTVFLDRSSPNSARNEDAVYVIVGITDKKVQHNADPDKVYR